MKPPVKTLSFVGTRPEAIKMAPLLLRMEQQPARFTSLVCVTGQHRQMLDQVVGTFHIQIHYDLDVMTEDQKLSDLTARLVTSADEVIREVSPELVFVQGDTTTAFAAALAAFYNGVPVAHVEAGLRTGDLQDPFPEEANRTLVDRLASYHFAPTGLNRQNLLREGIYSTSIFVTGNTGIDALLMMRDRVLHLDPDYWARSWGEAKDSILDQARFLLLITAHRRENFGSGMCSIFKALKELACRHADWDFVYPVHLNPNVRIPAHRILSGIPNIYLLAPLDYEPFIYLMNRADLILTDSGGIQEEAPSLGKPVIVLRDKTERREAVEAGTVIMAGTDKRRICSAVENLAQNVELYKEISERPNPYGNGTASIQILEAIWGAFRAQDTS